jgi:hypothetical protein
MNYNKKITIPSWLMIVVVAIILFFMAGGGYGFKEHRELKKSYKDSTKVRQEKILSLENTISLGEDFEKKENVTHRSYYNDFKKQQKLRKNAEALLFIYTNNSRRYNDSILTNYTFKRNK